MAKKIIITNELTNVYLWGIATSLNNLHLVMLINNQLRIRLQRSFNIISHNKKPLEGFPTFTHLNPNTTEGRYIIFVNRWATQVLFTQYPQFDYILALMGTFSDHELQRIPLLLKSIEGINACIAIDPLSLKNDREYLFLFD